ncbi:DUF2865 domain-containing protein [Pseudovibrio sp. Tun.PSC04-5.I4]|uniref:DUF2865 domain-containing protein n=1 Tax=Pseudovibrio sp. Tun.PSC04-5.I4 TaxID=1798213 RepID=UPI00088A03E1|nr:DUF2865 domain-containing protein [Pseudovibrio sp. Tun.PSC04-5.I4]SDQ93807.1 Protein of unknown function [Pseudovibrio sp. Tun.PSC04-5.I4]
MNLFRILPTRPTAALALSLGVSLIWVESSLARPQVCDRLEAEFVELSEQVESEGASNSWQTAYEEQLIHIRNVQSQMTSFSCDGSLGPPQCQQLSSSLQQMNENLTYLDSQRQQELYSSVVQDRLNEVRQALVDLNCSDRSDQQVQQPTDQLAPPAQLGGQPLQLEPRSTAGFSSGDQQFATMCVRKCDGYYFPINPNSNAGDLAEDTEICQALCPGQDTELFVFQVPQETPAQMRSLAGQPYSSLANAYVFRQTNDPACTCDGSGAASNSLDLAPSIPSLEQGIGSGQLQDLTPGATPTYPAIPSEGELRQDLNTIEAQSETSEPLIVQKKFVPREVEPRKGPIRKVGPKFFPDQ